MPCIGQFFGIAIYMYYNDHLPPHFHAEYGGDEALFSIANLEIVTGALPRRARGLVVEWASLHGGELRDNWDRARDGLALQQIESLD